VINRRAQLGARLGVWLARLMLIALALDAGCSPAMQRRVNIAALVVSESMIAWDGLQTMDQARAGWPYLEEANPIMGTSPSPATVGIYFGSALVINAVAWLLTPPRYRAVLPAIVTAVQIHVEVNGWFSGNDRAPIAPVTKSE